MEDAHLFHLTYERKNYIPTEKLFEYMKTLPTKVKLVMKEIYHYIVGAETTFWHGGDMKKVSIIEGS